MNEEAKALINSALEKSYNNGRQYELNRLKKYASEKLDMRFALDILCKQLIDEYITERGNND